MNERAKENLAGIAAAIASMSQHAEVIETMARNLRSQVADAQRRIAALHMADSERRTS